MDLDKAIEFLLNQQAQTSAQMQAVGEKLETLRAAVSKHDDQIGQMLVAINNLTENQLLLTKTQINLGESQVKVLDSVESLTQRLDSLARTFEDWLRHGGNGSRH